MQVTRVRRAGGLPSRHLFGLASLAIAANAVATAAAPALVAAHPLWLLLLDARNRHLALALGAGVGALPFFLIGIARALVFDPVFFLLGRRHGDTATEWLSRRSPRSARLVSKTSSLFDRAGSVIVLLSPNYAVCLAAGGSRMSWRRFLLLDGVSSLIQVYAVWVLGARFRGPLSLVVAFVRDRAVALTAVSTAVVVLLALRNRRPRAAVCGDAPVDGAQ